MEMDANCIIRPTMIQSDAGQFVLQILPNGQYCYVPEGCQVASDSPSLYCFCLLSAYML